MGRESGSELLTKVQVVEGASLHFSDHSEARHDNWDIEWEATPAPTRRAPSPPEKPIPERLPEPVYVPPPDATPGPATRMAEAVEPEPDEPDDTFPPLSEVVVPPVHDLHPPGHVEPGAPGDASPTWDPPERREVEPSGVALPPGGVQAPQRRPSITTAAVDALPAVFEGLSHRRIKEAVQHFDIFEVRPGTVLIEEGEKHPALVMILVGEVESSRRGEHRMAVEGECMGFTTLFGNGTWSSTLTAATPARLLVLDLEGFRALRAEGSVVSVAVEEYALDRLLDTLDRTRQRVTELSAGRPMESFVPKPGFFERLADVFGMGGIMATRTDAAAALGASPLFRNADRAHLAALGEHLHALKAQPGSFFLRQGEASPSLFLVVEGQVDVLTSPGTERAVRHETLFPGQLFGVWGVLRDSPSRTSVVARTRCVVLELERIAWAELAPVHSPEASVLRLAVLRGITERLIAEGARLASLQAGHAPVVEATSSGSFLTIDPIDRR